MPKALLRIAPLMQSLRLLKEVKKKKKKPVKKAVDILTGVPLIKATSNVIESY